MLRLLLLTVVTSRVLSAISVIEYAHESQKDKLADFRLCVRDRMKQLRLYDPELWKIVEPELTDETPTKPGIKPLQRVNLNVRSIVDSGPNTKNSKYLEIQLEYLIDGVMLEIFPETKAFSREIHFKVHRPPKGYPKPRPSVWLQSYGR